MELKEIKKIVVFARKSGIRALSSGDLSFELFDGKPRTRSAKRITVTDAPIKSSAQDPTLEEINKYIYSDEE